MSPNFRDRYLNINKLLTFKPTSKVFQDYTRIKRLFSQHCKSGITPEAAQIFVSCPFSSKDFISTTLKQSVILVLLHLINIYLQSTLAEKDSSFQLHMVAIQETALSKIKANIKCHRLQELFVSQWVWNTKSLRCMLSCCSAFLKKRFIIEILFDFFVLGLKSFDSI